MIRGWWGCLVLAGLLADVCSSASSFGSPQLHKVVSIRVSLLPLLILRCDN